MRRALVTASLLVSATAAFAGYDFYVEVKPRGTDIFVNNGHWTDNQELVYATDEFGRKSLIPGASSDGAVSFDCPIGGGTNELTNWFSSAIAGKPFPFQGRLAQRDERTGDAHGVTWQECWLTSITFPGFDKTVKPKGGGSTMPSGSTCQLNCRVAGKKLYVGNLPFSAIERKRGDDKATTVAGVDVIMTVPNSDGTVSQMQMNGISRCGSLTATARTNDADIACGDSLMVASGGSPAAGMFQEWFRAQSSSRTGGQERTIQLVYRNAFGQQLGTLTLEGCGLYRCGWNSDCDDDYIPDLSVAMYVQRIKWNSSNPSDG